MHHRLFWFHDRWWQLEVLEIGSGWLYALSSAPSSREEYIPEYIVINGLSRRFESAKGYWAHHSILGMFGQPWRQFTATHARWWDVTEIQRCTRDGFCKRYTIVEPGIVCKAESKAERIREKRLAKDRGRSTRWRRGSWAQRRVGGNGCVCLGRVWYGSARPLRCWGSIGRDGQGREGSSQWRCLSRDVLISVKWEHMSETDWEIKGKKCKRLLLTPCEPSGRPATTLSSSTVAGRDALSTCSSIGSMPALTKLALIASNWTSVFSSWLTLAGRVVVCLGSCPSITLHHSMSASTRRPLLSDAERRGRCGPPALRACAADNDSEDGYGLERIEPTGVETERRRGILREGWREVGNRWREERVGWGRRRLWERVVEDDGEDGGDDEEERRRWRGGVVVGGGKKGGRTSEWID